MADSDDPQNDDLEHLEALAGVAALLRGDDPDQAVEALRVGNVGAGLPEDHVPALIAYLEGEDPGVEPS